MSVALDERRNSITGSLFFLSGRRSGVSEAGWQERLAPVRCELQFVYLFAEVGFSGASEQTNAVAGSACLPRYKDSVPLSAAGGLVPSWFPCGFLTGDFRKQLHSRDWKSGAQARRGRASTWLGVANPFAKMRQNSTVAIQNCAKMGRF